MLKKSSKLKIIIKINILFIFLLLISCTSPKLPDFMTGLNDSIGFNSANTPKVLNKVNFMTNWTLNSQFSAYYVGKEVGIYQKYGIDIQIIPYDNMIDYNDKFKNNKIDFALLWLTDALELNNIDAEIVNLAQFSKKSSVMFVSKKKSKIQSINDFNGKRIAVWQDFQNQANSFFMKNKIKPVVVPIFNSLNLFYCDGVELITANYFDEYHSILNSGFDSSDLKVFFLADYGFNFLEDGLYCKKELVQLNPDLCMNFTKATIESWKYVFAHKKEALSIIEKVMKANKKPYNKAHQKWMLDRFEEMYIYNGDVNIYLSEKEYDNNVKILSDEKIIQKHIPYKDFYKPYNNLKSK